MQLSHTRVAHSESQLNLSACLQQLQCRLLSYTLSVEGFGVGVTVPRLSCKLRDSFERNANLGH
jgi:hypothetical protein